MRIMAWNIQFFTEKRVNNPTGKTTDERVQNMLTAGANRQYIVSTVAKSDPSIFIVIEPLSDSGTTGTLADGGGPQGLLYLLNAFRQYDANWCLVPPLKTRNRELDGKTYTETVGVFYRSDRLTFVGPWIWPAAAQAAGPSVPPGAMAATYPVPWNGTVPLGTTAAAQCQFYNNNGTEITFPDPESRRPVLTTFTEIAAPNRTLKVFSCHTKPGTNAGTATARMAGLAEAVPGANQVSVLIGDFNLDLRSTNTVTQSYASYLSGMAGYTPVINKPPTMYRQVGKATPQNYQNNLCVDNAWVRYGTGARPMGLPRGYVINRVIDDTGPAPGLPWDMLDSVGEILNLPAQNQNSVFRENVNFGHLGPPAAGTSDHLPIVADV